MSVDFQDDLAEDWDMAAAMSETDPMAIADDGIGSGTKKYSNLNEALFEAGSALGDISGTLPIAFRFTWRDMPVFCRIEDRDGAATLILETDLGPVPYTVENKERRAYLKQLNNARLELPIGAFTVTDRSRFRHRVERVLEAPITGRSIVTAVVQLLLTARPYFELAKAS